MNNFKIKIEIICPFTGFKMKFNRGAISLTHLWVDGSISITYASRARMEREI
jgi:hypothetical protein